jgi:hypothetical protein
LSVAVVGGGCRWRLSVAVCYRRTAMLRPINFVAAW